jgi:hypothetical protein
MPVIRSKTGEERSGVFGKSMDSTQKKLGGIGEEEGAQAAATLREGSERRRSEKPS